MPNAFVVIHQYGGLRQFAEQGGCSIPQRRCVTYTLAINESRWPNFHRVVAEQLPVADRTAWRVLMDEAA